MASEAQDREGKLKAEYEMGTKAFRIVFDMRKELWPPEDTDEYWNGLWNKVRQTNAENDGNRLLDEMMVALVRYLEGVYKTDVLKTDENEPERTTLF